VKSRTVSTCFRALAATLLLFGFSVEAQNKHLRLRNEIITTGPPARIGAPARANDRVVSGLFLIQFNDPLQPAWKEELRLLRVELLRYVPDDAFVARFDNVRLSEVESLGYVRWVGVYRTDHKIHPALRAPRNRQPAGEALAIAVLFSPLATPGEIAGLC